MGVEFRIDLGQELLPARQRAARRRGRQLRRRQSQPVVPAKARSAASRDP
jgi:hypothetical protein